MHRRLVDVWTATVFDTNTVERSEAFDREFSEAHTQSPKENGGGPGEGSGDGDGGGGGSGKHGRVRRLHGLPADQARMALPGRR